MDCYRHREWGYDGDDVGIFTFAEWVVELDHRRDVVVSSCCCALPDGDGVPESWSDWGVEDRDRWITTYKFCSCQKGEVIVFGRQWTRVETNSVTDPSTDDDALIGRDGRDDCPLSCWLKDNCSCHEGMAMNASIGGGGCGDCLLPCWYKDWVAELDRRRDAVLSLCCGLCDVVPISWFNWSMEDRTRWITSYKCSCQVGMMIDASIDDGEDGDWSSEIIYSPAMEFPDEVVVSHSALEALQYEYSEGHPMECGL